MAPGSAGWCSWLIGRWFGASGAIALPWSIVALSVLAVASFAVSDRVLGG